MQKKLDKKKYNKLKGHTDEEKMANFRVQEQTNHNF